MHRGEDQGRDRPESEAAPVFWGENGEPRLLGAGIGEPCLLWGGDWGTTPHLGRDWGATPLWGRDWGITPHLGRDWGAMTPRGGDWGSHTSSPLRTRDAVSVGWAGPSTSTSPHAEYS